MTWLYIPSASVPASEGSTSALELLDPMRAASLSWRGKHQQPQAWSRAWKRGGFIRLLSGLTCEPSALEHGVAQWIASCRAIPAKGTASPESDLVKPMTDGCSTGLSRSLTKAGLIPSSVRTSRGTSRGSSQSQSRHWSDWTVALRSEYSARLRPGRAIGGSDSSYWPTAVVKDDGKTPDGHLAMKKRMGERDGTYANRTAITSLAVKVQDWSTPKASDGEKGGPNMRGSKGDQPLPAQAAHWLTPLVADAGEKVTAASHQKALMNQAAQWPTPMAGSSGTDTYNAAGNSDFSRKAEELAKVVRAFAMVDLSLPDRPTPSGEKSSETRRRLNPLFVEWLMGWPEGLSGFGTAETASCRSPQPSLGCDCMNCWLTRQREMLSDLLTISPPAQGSLL